MLVLVQDVSCYGNAGDVSELATLCVKGKREHVASRLDERAHEKIRKLSEVGIYVKTMQHTDLVHV